MIIPAKKIRMVTFCFGLSVAVHLLVLISLGRFGSYSFAAPVNQLQAVMVDLTKPGDDAAPRAESDARKSSTADNASEDVPDNGNQAGMQGAEGSTPAAVPEKGAFETKGVETAAIGKEKTEILTRTSETATAPRPAVSRVTASAAALPPPVRTVDEFMSSKSEKLSYLISLMGVPVGSAELEAKAENGEVRITLRTRSNAVLSSIYPVDDVMETRHIGGNFIITKIRQQEGTFKSDIGFTLFLRDKRVFWVDRLRNRVSNETIPNSFVLDTLSSFYYLRNRPLQIGTTELLYIYDGDVYAPVPVEILRREEVRLRNFTRLDSLVVRHLKQEGGIFRRSGDMTVWLSNDENRVPLKVETTTHVGKVTIELVAAETEPSDRPGTQKSFPLMPYSATSNIP